MEAIRQYLISVTAAAILCGIVKGLFPEKGTVGVLVRMMAGLFLTATVIAPLTRISIDSDFAFALEADARAAVAVGENAAAKSLAAGIKARAEAYILDKADSPDLTVSVTLDTGYPPVPVGVVLRGRISPYGRSLLERIITEDLGIAKEQIVWTG